MKDPKVDRFRGIAQPSNVPEPVKFDRPPDPPRIGLRTEYTTSAGNKLLGTPLCPDLLRIGDIGEADGWRGHVVRGFFRVLRVVTGV